MSLSKYTVALDYTPKWTLTWTASAQTPISSVHATFLSALGGQCPDKLPELHVYGGGGAR